MIVRYYPSFFASEYYKEPIPWYFLAGGFSFTYGYWIREVPADADIYFSGEETVWQVQRHLIN